ncbi:MAG: hypothetical protein ACO3EK_18270 [Alphaproteobacteria bacterium]
MLSGSMPSPAEEIRGCVFASRCPRRIEGTCDVLPPPERRFGEHRIACHLELGPPAPA